MIRTQGTLIVKKIPGRNGPFAVADLVTDVAEFKVKDPLLDQFEDGEYQGTFFISEIFLAPYVSFGRCVTELRARLHDVRIDSQNRPKKGAPEQEEPDPLDETPAPRARIKPLDANKPKGPKADAGKSTAGASPSPAPAADSAPADRSTECDDDDQALFGPDIHAAVQAGDEVKLDPTIDDRARFRAQTARLRELGYRFDSKRQAWLKS